MDPRFHEDDNLLGLAIKFFLNNHEVLQPYNCFKIRNDEDNPYL